MSGIVGVELETDRVRAVVLQRWRAAPRATCEVEWDATDPASLVARLRERCGPASRIALSVGLGFLHVKHVGLPPALVEERRRMLALETDRFFAVGEEPLVVALHGERNLAFAIEEGLLAHWIAAFETWAPVDRIEALPLSLARALGRAGADGSFAVPAQPGEHGVVELHGGRLHGARRIPGDAPAPATQSLPDTRGVPGAYLAALGAARGLEDTLDGALLPARHAARIRRRRTARTTVAAAACIAALALALWAADRSRERTLQAIRATVARIEPVAAQAIVQREALEALDRESAMITAISARRPDPLRVLAALSERLPAGATVLSVRANGEAWQIDGRAGDAAAILPALDGDARFEDVRFLSASTRFREGDRTWETFSIAFRVRPAA